MERHWKVKGRTKNVNSIFMFSSQSLKSYRSKSTGDVKTTIPLSNGNFPPFAGNQHPYVNQRITTKPQESVVSAPFFFTFMYLLTIKLFAFRYAFQMPHTQ